MNEYDQQAADFLSKHGLKIMLGRRVQEAGKGSGGWHFVYRGSKLQRQDGKWFIFTMHGSIADCKENKDPSDYDVLTCLSSDSTVPDTVLGFIQDFGFKPEPGVIAQCKRLRAFLTEQELEDLREIY